MVLACLLVQTSQGSFVAINNWKARDAMVDEKRGPQPGTPQARHGGEAVKQKYGAKFYSQIGKKGGEAVKQEKGPEFYAQIGKKGGEATKRSHGSKFYAEILTILKGA
jgi:uncharacterized protein